MSGTETVLLVDDDPAVRRMMARALREEGYTVIEASDGEDAMAAVEEYGAPIHVIVADLLMPQLNGAELLETLHRWYPSIRALLVSGYVDEAQAIMERTGAPSAFLAKPFPPVALTDAVASLLAGS